MSDNQYGLKILSAGIPKHVDTKLNVVTDCDEELGDDMSVEAGELEFGPASSAT